MNKLLCVMGFALCFSSFCMNNENTIDIAKQREAIEIAVSAMSDMNERKIDDECNLSEESSSNKVLNARDFTIDKKKCTLFSCLLFKLRSGLDKMFEKSKDQLNDANRNENYYDLRIANIALSAIDHNYIEFAYHLICICNK